MLSQREMSPVAAIASQTAAASCEASTAPQPVRGAVDLVSDWRRALAAAIRDPAELIARLTLPDDLLGPAGGAARSFPVVVPESYLRRMRKGDPLDPLLLQVLPRRAELVGDETLPTDAVGDAAARRAPGLLHKYAGRALLIAARECAVHCRYCFRRHYPYEEAPVSGDEWTPALDSIAGDPSLHEIILSGGDPLVLSDRRLGELISRLAAIPHVTRLRIHTRLPIVLPERITQTLLSLFRSTRLRTIMVVHANHPAEIVDDCADALQQIVEAGIPALNQSVLLRGVNDSADTLAELSDRLVDLGVMPYYLHQLDRVAGVTHFEVPEAEGLALVEDLRRRLPGYAAPRYVREVAGLAFKQPLVD
jgi:EF-P beta-lysylation protein EpmB